MPSFGKCPSSNIDFFLILSVTRTGNLPSVGGGGDSGDGGDKERDAEEERLRQEAIKEAEEKRRLKHKKMEEEREGIRANIREKVWFCLII